MSTNQISISVRGIKPAPWGNNEWNWRKAIADVARENYKEEFSSPLEFSVNIVFYLLKSTLDKSDLDNLAKPVLDTLFLPNNPQVKDIALTGSLFKIDDNRVFKLSLEKLLVSTNQEEGAEINVSWEE
jgi:Holliday junction resolvase RusA-like endonuclease